MYAALGFTYHLKGGTGSLHKAIDYYHQALGLKSEDTFATEMLRKAFEDDHLLPPEILWRPKEAFSDGVSKSDDSWHTILNRHVDHMVSDDAFHTTTTNHDDDHDINPPKLKETFYYRRIFEKIYGKHHLGIIPYYWLPKWCGDDLVDPSAREILD